MFYSILTTESIKFIINKFSPIIVFYCFNFGVKGLFSSFNMFNKYLKNISLSLYWINCYSFWKFVNNRQKNIFYPLYLYPLTGPQTSKTNNSKGLLTQGFSIGWKETRLCLFNWQISQKFHLSSNQVFISIMIKSELTWANLWCQLII